jgi:hypothetical protein
MEIQHIKIGDQKYSKEMEENVGCRDVNPNPSYKSIT